MISINCPKCGKNYELTEELKGKKMKCVCGEVFTENEAIVDLKETIKSSKGQYIKQSYGFIGKNIVSLLLFTIISSFIITGLMYLMQAKLNLSSLNIIIYFISFSLVSTFIIQLIKGNKLNENNSLLKTIKESKNNILPNLLINLINTLILMVAIIPILLGISNIYRASTLMNGSGQEGLETGVALMALAGLILFVIGIILLLVLAYPLTKYTLALQCNIFDGHKALRSFKESGRVTFGHKWRILGIELMYLVGFVIAWLSISYITSLFASISELWLFIAINITMFCWLSLKINLHIVYTHLFMNITGKNK